MTMSDRIAVMRAGRIEQLGDPESLYERPETAFVAGFLGVSNLLEGEVAGHEGGMIAIRLKDGTLIKAPAGTNGQTSVRLGVRPEKLRVSSNDSQSAGTDVNAVEGTVLDASYIGVSTQYLVQMPWGQELAVFEQNTGTHGDFKPGDPVDLHWRPEHTFLLDASQDATAGAELEDDG